ncbi:MAG: CDP-glycerol glycerophosphotransferase family protein [Oscillospiraceae bacterium]|nr:CDP-glycerol glycerophosphotransferase family protein [Oscillospiraceae bacterium]
MAEYKYDFSVVMAVYNSEKYLQEAVESLVHQTFGFSRIQLILVDDGSTDGSGAICDSYQNKYPGNVIAVHKENGGVSSARNAGIPYTEGRYLNFMDSDDIITPNTFKNVYRFFRRHEEQTDVCTVPIYYFGAIQGPHWQNWKFDRGSRIIDLHEEDDTTLMVVTASFFKASLKKRINFDSHLVCGEDFKVCMEILIDRMTLGVVREGCYKYRRRIEDNPSLVQSAKKKKGWYDDYFTHLVEWGIGIYQDKYGYIPGFVQYELLSDLQWRFCENYENDMVDVLGYDRNLIAAYKNRLTACLKQFEDKYILQMKMLKEEHKHYMLELKHSETAALRMEKQDAGLWFGETLSTRVSEMETVLEFLEFDEEHNTWFLEGHYVVFGIGIDQLTPYICINGRYIPCETIDRSNRGTKSLGKRISTYLGFRAVIPATIEKIKIVAALRLNNVFIKCGNIMFGDFFPVSDIYRYAYANVAGRGIVFQKNSLLIVPEPDVIRAVVREIRYIKEIWKKDLLGGRKALAGRAFYHVVKPFKRKKLWIVSDRIMKADDNGEAFFRYLMEHKPENTKVVFALSKNSPDYRRMSEIGPCINAMSLQHKLLHLISDMIISSHADGVTRNPFMGYHDALRDLLVHQKYIFLQHGIIKNDLSEWLERYKQNIQGFVTSTLPEWKSIVNKKEYNYSAEEIWLTGLPRYDRLYHDEKKLITILPTWRLYLLDHSDPKTGIWEIKTGFEEQPYFRFYNALINSDRLLSGLAEYSYTLQFFPHPAMQPHIGYFHRDPRVRFLTIETSYREVFAESALVLTDYSSAVFDFAYLRKPVLYCHFDRQEFFQGRHAYKEGYFDYVQDGFGEVTYDLDHTIDLILEYVANDCLLKDLYRKRIDEFFAYNDQNNCKRVLDKIVELEDRL